MWDKPRSEIISVDTDRLARHAFTQMGLVCLQTSPIADGKHTLLTLHTEWRDRAGAQERYWFRSQKDADAVLHEMLTLEAMFWKASRVDDGVLLDVANDRIVDVLAECLKWCGSRSALGGGVARFVGPEEVDSRIASVKVEIDRALVQMQCTGGMTLLNRQYKALRTARAEGEKLPSFKNWLTAQLEARVLQLLALPAL